MSPARCPPWPGFFLGEFDERDGALEGIRLNLTVPGFLFQNATGTHGFLRVSGTV